MFHVCYLTIFLYKMFWEGMYSEMPYLGIKNIIMWYIMSNVIGNIIRRCHCWFFFVRNIYNHSNMKLSIISI